MNKGFTLIELLGVIVILGILAMIAVPVIDNSVNKSKDNLYVTQESQIIKGTKDYYAEHISELPQNDGDVITITIQELQEAGYLPLEIKNPKTNEDFAPTTTILVTKEGKGFKYELDKDTIGGA